MTTTTTTTIKLSWQENFFENLSWLERPAIFFIPVSFSDGGSYNSVFFFDGLPAADCTHVTRIEYLTEFYIFLLILTGCRVELVTTYLNT